MPAVLPLPLAVVVGLLFVVAVVAAVPVVGVAGLLFFVAVVVVVAAVPVVGVAGLLAVVAAVPVGPVRFPHVRSHLPRSRIDNLFVAAVAVAVAHARGLRVAVDLVPCQPTHRRSDTA